MLFPKFSNVYDDFFLYTPSFQTPRRTVKTVKRTEEGYNIEVEVPGCSEKDVDVEISGRELSVKAKVRGRDLYHSYSIPDRVDIDNITAKVEHGLLTIDIPDGPTFSRKLLSSSPDPPELTS